MNGSQCIVICSYMRVHELVCWWASGVIFAGLFSKLVNFSKIFSVARLLDNLQNYLISEHYSDRWGEFLKKNQIFPNFQKLKKVGNCSKSAQIQKNGRIFFQNVLKNFENVWFSAHLRQFLAKKIFLIFFKIFLNWYILWHVSVKPDLTQIRSVSPDLSFNRSPSDTFSASPDLCQTPHVSEFRLG